MFGWEIRRLNTVSENKILNKFSQLICNTFCLYLLLLTSFLVFLLLFSFHYYGYATISLYVSLGVSFYLTIFTKKLNIGTTRKFSDSWIKLCMILFFLTYTLSILHLQIIDDMYHKSLGYYFLIGICSFLIFFISIYDEKNVFGNLLPILVFFLSINIFFSNFIVFSEGTYASGDTHYQIYNIVLPIIGDGTIPVDESYSFFPLHQIYIASLSLLSGLNAIFLYKIATSFLYAFSSFFIYLLGKYFIGPKFGIICMLIYIISPEIVYHATHAYQFSYALIIGIILLYIVLLTIPKDFKRIEFQNNNNKVSWTILRILLIISIVWMHQFTSAVIFGVILLFALFSILFRESNLNSKGLFSGFLLLFLVSMFAHWIFVSLKFSSLIRIANIYYTSFFSVENYQASSVYVPSIIQPLMIQFLDISGKGIIIMFASLGSLYGMSKKNSYVYFWSFLGFFIFSLVSIGSFIRTPILLGGRLMAFFWAFSIVYLAALGIMILVEKLGTKGIALCCILLFIAPVLTLGSVSSGTESSFFKNFYPSDRLYDTEIDLSYYSWIQKMVPEGSFIMVSKSWVPQYYDNMRIYDQLPINNQNSIDLRIITYGDYLVLNDNDCEGIRVRGISESEWIQSTVITKNQSLVATKDTHMRDTRLNLEELKRISSDLNCIYSSSKINICTS